jgi:hypothetical protein
MCVKTHGDDASMVFSEQLTDLEGFCFNACLTESINAVKR